MVFISSWRSWWLKCHHMMSSVRTSVSRCHKQSSSSFTLSDAEKKSLIQAYRGLIKSCLTSSFTAVTPWTHSAHNSAGEALRRHCMILQDLHKSVQMYLYRPVQWDVVQRSRELSMEFKWHCFAKRSLLSFLSMIFGNILF